MIEQFQHILANERYSDIRKIEYKLALPQHLMNIRFNEEIEERFEIMMQEFDNTYNKAAVFISAPNQLKEAYVQLRAGYRY